MNPASPRYSPAALLAGWEAGAALPAVARCIGVLAEWGLTDGVDAGLDLPVGVHAAQAASAFRALFGPAVEVITVCAACGATLEVTMTLDRFADAEGADQAGRAATVGSAVGPLQVRVPTTRDLIAASDAPDAAEELMARCLRRADGQPLAPDQPARLTAEDRAAIEAAAERLDRTASALRTDCPGCHSLVSAPVDIGALLWDRVDAEARRLLAEVAELAAAFGWSERDVLALPATRRAAYLALCDERTAAPRYPAVGG